MNWILLAIIPQFLWAFSNLIDEYLSKNHFKNPLIMVVAAALLQLFPGIGLLLYLNFQETLPTLPVQTIFSLCFFGAMIMLSILPYIKAVQIDGAGVAVPMFQMIPVFTFILAWLILGEVMALPKILAAGIIILASIGMTVDFKAKGVSLKTFYLMATCSIGFALYNIASRYFLKDIEWVVVMAWMWLGAGIFGLLWVIWRADMRAEIRQKLLNPTNIHISALFLFQAVLDFIGFSFILMALQNAPQAALVAALGGTQSLFIFVLAGLAGLILPGKFQKNASKYVMAWRFFCIFMILLGVTLITLLE